MDTELFDSEFLRKLEHLTLMSRRLHRGEARGEHQTYRKGSSLEFYDYRSYQPGDDFRYIDWSIYSRLHRLFVKLFASEEDLTLHILLDNSESMQFGEPRKIDYARRVGASLGYIGIANLDRVGITSFSSELGNSLPPHRSRSHVFSLFDHFSKLKTGGTTQFNRCLTEFSLREKKSGLAVVISDLLDAEGFDKGLLALLYRGFDVVLIQILDEREIEPARRGAFRLIDGETAEFERVTIDDAMIRLYDRTLQKFFSGVEDFCLKRGIEYLRASTMIPFEDLILKYLRQGMYLH
jgi:uncharacterized protein (DUF58 family)